MSRRVDFWSSTECSPFLPPLAAALGAQGWDVRSRFMISERAYRGARGLGGRLAMRVSAYVLYPTRLVGALCGRDRSQVTVVCTNTFFAPRVAQLCGTTPVVHWVFDLFPDVLVIAGTLRADSLVERWLRGLTRRTYARAEVNVFLGENIRRHAESRFGPISRSVVIPVGTDVAPFADGVLARNPGVSPTILYCGNFGRMHDVDTVGGALAALESLQVCWRFLGHGQGLRRLAEAHAWLKNCEFGGNLPEHRWVEAMRTADVGLVTLCAGAEGLVMPSKTYSAMAAGQAILAVCPRQSDLADTVLRHQCGWVVEPGDNAGFRSAVSAIAQDAPGLRLKREAAWRAARDHYSAEALAPQWAAVLGHPRCRPPEIDRASLVRTAEDSVKNGESR